MEGQQRRIPLTLTTLEYLDGLEFKLSKILRDYMLPPRAEDKIAEIADELRRAAWRIRRRDLARQKKERQQCQPPNGPNSISQ